jgi:hypothetical protein
LPDNIHSNKPKLLQPTEKPMTVSSHVRVEIPTDRLLFDIQNPRLVGELSSGSTGDIPVIQHLCETADIAELVISIIKNTFVDFEPIVVIKATDQNYRVLEGNRRLAAIKLLLDPILSQQLESSLKYHIDRPLPLDVEASIKTIQAIEVTCEEDAQAYIGFKHINGPHKWTSFAKAKFVTNWFKQGMPIDEIARKVGDKNQTVKDLIAGMLVLEQAEEEELFDISDRTKRGVFGFSHLYTALNRKEYRSFLGLSKGWTDDMQENPVKKENLDKLEKTLKYMYGSKRDSIDSVIKSQNPHLGELGVVLSHPIAIQKLIDTNNLQLALEETESQSALFEKSLIASHTNLQKAAGTVSSYSGGKAIFDLAKNMEKMLEVIVDSMEKLSNGN